MRGMRLTGVAVVVAALTLAGVAVHADTSGTAQRWTPPHQLVHEVVTPGQSIVTTERGMTVVAWTARRGAGSFLVRAAVQPRGDTWGRPVVVSGSAEKVAGVQAVAWGAGKVSVFWEREVGRDDWQFRMRTVNAAGAWGPVVTLRTAVHAYPGFLADVNADGVVALSWESGDHRVRVALRGTDRTWRAAPPVPVVSPGAPSRFVDNPRAMFLTDAGQVIVVAWGHRQGSAGSLWLERLGRADDWHSTRIGPTQGQRLAYNWVPQARFAADPDGNLAAVWSQQDPQTHRWTTLVRYRSTAGGGLGPAQTLGHARCDYLYQWCADVAMGSSGRAVLAWAKPGADGQRVVAARTTRSGRLSAPQTLYAESVDYVFRGVAVEANASGDATINFIGGDAKVFYQEFARCPAGSRCRPLVRRENAPSWLDPLAFTVAPSGVSTMSWATGCAGGEACRPDRVWARRLSAAG